jgi:hypothetical protein
VDTDDLIRDQWAAARAALHRDTEGLAAILDHTDVRQLAEDQAATIAALITMHAQAAGIGEDDRATWADTRLLRLLAAHQPTGTGT